MSGAGAGRITVRLQPRASRDELLGTRDGVLVARVCAPPVGGRANEALCRMVARRLDIPRSRVRVALGERSRQKVVEVDGLDAAALARALG